MHTLTQALAKQFHNQFDQFQLPSKLDSLRTPTQALAKQFHYQSNHSPISINSTQSKLDSLLPSNIDSLRTSTQALAKQLHIRFDQSQLPRPQGSQPTMRTTPLCYLSLPLPLCNLFLCAILPLAITCPGTGFADAPPLPSSDHHNHKQYNTNNTSSNNSSNMHIHTTKTRNWGSTHSPPPEYYFDLS